MPSPTALTSRKPPSFVHLRSTSKRARNSSMPSRLRSALPRSLSRPLDPGGLYYCPSCAPRRRTLTTRTECTANVDKLGRSRQVARLSGSTSGTSVRPFTTSPAINPGKTVPPRFKELYDALSGIKDAAIEQVSISRLQLALRGLESETPLIRIAGEYWRFEKFYLAHGN